LGPESRLSTEKVFTAAAVVVNVSPSLFGRPLEELATVVGRVLAAPESVPLLRVRGARQQAYATASVLAIESAIAEVVAKGTATPGQAARTLGREAGIAGSRTLASLLWRLDHRSLNLTTGHVVVLDEAGMTDDPAMLRLLTAADIAGAKVVLVGDHRQLDAVGPGGAFRAVLNRHHGQVH